MMSDDPKRWQVVEIVDFWNGQPVAPPHEVMRVTGIRRDRDAVYPRFEIWDAALQRYRDAGEVRMPFDAPEFE